MPASATMTAKTAMPGETGMPGKTVVEVTMEFVANFSVAIPVTVIPAMVPTTPAIIERVIGRIAVRVGRTAIVNALHASGQEETYADQE
jgi:hypothetical protein